MKPLSESAASFVSPARVANRLFGCASQPPAGLHVLYGPFTPSSGRLVEAVANAPAQPDHRTTGGMLSHGTRASERQRRLGRARRWLDRVCRHRTGGTVAIQAAAACCEASLQNASRSRRTSHPLRPNSPKLAPGFSSPGRIPVCLQAAAAHPARSFTVHCCAVYRLFTSSALGFGP